MKFLLLMVGVLLGACSARPYAPLALPPPSGTPPVGTRSIMLYVPDSVRQASAKLVQGLTRAGFPSPTIRLAPQAEYAILGTGPKTVAQVTGLVLQVTIDPITPGNAGLLLGKNPPKGAQRQAITGGSVITFLGTFVPVDSLGHPQPRSPRVVRLSHGRPDPNVPTQALWDDMHTAAFSCFPGAGVRYF